MEDKDMKITYNHVNLAQTQGTLPQPLQKAREAMMSEEQKVLFKPQPMKVQTPDSKKQFQNMQTTSEPKQSFHP